VQAVVTRIAARSKSSLQGQGARSKSSDASSAPMFESGPVQTNSSQTESSPSESKKSLMTFLSKNIASSLATDQPAHTSDWDKARAKLRVGGIMKTDNQLFATVNQKIVKVNDTVSADLNGRLYHFKVHRIDFRHKTVQFEPIGP